MSEESKTGAAGAGAGAGAGAATADSDSAVVDCVFSEATVVTLPVADVWARVRLLGLDTLLPSAVERCVVTKLSPMEVGCVREIEWRSGATWITKQTELSDETRTVSFELDSSKPRAPYRSRRDSLQLHAVTNDASGPVDYTMVEWNVEVSPDAPAEAVTAARDQVANGLQKLGAALLGLPGRPYELPELTDDDVAIYYGSLKVKFSPVGGTTLPYTEGCLTQGENSAAARAEAHKYMGPLSTLSDEWKEAGGYEHIYMPCIPSVPPKEKWDESKVDALPEALRKPLIKTADGTIEGLRSGGRSAIFLIGKQAYRLKGCGNYVDGEYNGKSLRFPYPGLPVAKMYKLDWTTYSVDEEAREVRGCAFDTTAKQELLMSGEVDKVLRPNNFLCGLNPAGMWRYDIPEAELPLVQKACALSKTFGERRLASHLLTGVELLLPRMLDAEPDVSKVLELLGEFRAKPYTEKLWNPDTGAQEGEAKHPVQPTFIAVMHEAAMADCTGIRMNEKRPDLPASELSGHGHDFTTAWKHALATYNAACQRFLAEQADGDDGDSADEAEEAAGAGAAAGAGDSKGEEEESFGARGALLFHLYWRLGHEAGAIRRCMSDNNISWGYYLDHLPEPHNNSHPNNLIVLPPSASGFGPVLAPVDLDMAYRRESYFANSNGELDDREFMANLKSEQKALRENLGGSTASTGLADMQGADLTEKQVVMKWALRDTLIAGFDCGVNKRVNPHPTTRAADIACHALVRMALIAACGRSS